MGKSRDWKLGALLAGAALVALATGNAAAQVSLTAPSGEDAAAEKRSAPNGSFAGDVEEIGVAVNKSRIITTGRRFREVAVGNSDIADVVPLSRDRLYVLGKSIGSTSIILTDQSGEVISVYDVAVGYDSDGLKRKIHEVSPGTEVEVRAAGDSLVLSGTVTDAGKAGSIAALAERYAPGRVTNMIGVAGSQQVMLQVRFAEVQRSVLKELGVTTDLLKADGGDSFLSLVGDGGNPLSFVTGGALIRGGSFALDVVVDALERKGLVRTLAEPNIISLSGDTASFLAGGEFPIPVAQSSSGAAGSVGGINAITVEFKEFGVGLSFTPTVLGENAINLELAAEVSSIDPSITVTLGNISIPGLKVRRISNTVELLDGQSFAIAGLIQDDLTEQARQAPWIGSLPIIGALARSSNFERRQTELVVIITARIVKPVNGDRLASPTDFIQPPGEFDYFLLGKSERVVTTTGAGGIEGKYGYVQP